MGAARLEIGEDGVQQLVADDAQHGSVGAHHGHHHIQAVHGDERAHRVRAAPSLRHLEPGEKLGLDVQGETAVVLALRGGGRGEAAEGSTPRDATTPAA